MEELAVVTGYIMYYDLLEFKINGSFFSKIDKAMELASILPVLLILPETVNEVNVPTLLIFG